MWQTKAKICLMVFIFLAGTVIAATDESQGRMSSGTSGTTAGKTNVLLSANKIMGADVTNNNDEKLGTVKELIVNQNKDNVQYVIVSADDMLHPVPMAAIRCSSPAETSGMTDANAEKDKTSTKLTLDISKDQFRSAPSIDSIDTTALSSSSLKQKTDSFYSTQMQKGQGAWEKMKTEAKERMPESMRDKMGGETEGQAANLIKGSDLIGMDVRGMNDEQLASVKDVVIDSRKGNLAYGLLSYGGVLGVSEKVAAVPWTAISIQPDQSMAKIDATQDKLESTTLPEGRIAQLNQKEFAQRVHEVFGAEPYWQVYGFEAPGESGTQQQRQRDDTRDQLKKEMKERRDEYQQERQGGAY